MHLPNPDDMVQDLYKSHISSFASRIHRSCDLKDSLSSSDVRCSTVIKRDSLLQHRPYSYT